MNANWTDPTFKKIVMAAIVLSALILILLLRRVIYVSMIKKRPKIAEEVVASIDEPSRTQSLSESSNSVPNEGADLLAPPNTSEAENNPTDSTNSPIIQPSAEQNTTFSIQDGLDTSASAPKSTPTVMPQERSNAIPTYTAGAPDTSFYPTITPQDNQREDRNKKPKGPGGTGAQIPETKVAKIEKTQLDHSASHLADIANKNEEIVELVKKLDATTSELHTAVARTMQEDMNNPALLAIAKMLESNTKDQRMQLSKKLIKGLSQQKTTQSTMETHINVALQSAREAGPIIQRYSFIKKDNADSPLADEIKVRKSLMEFSDELTQYEQKGQGKEGAQAINAKFALLIKDTEKMITAIESDIKVLKLAKAHFSACDCFLQNRASEITSQHPLATWHGELAKFRPSWIGFSEFVCNNESRLAWQNHAKDHTQREWISYTDRLAYQADYDAKLEHNDQQRFVWSVLSIQDPQDPILQSPLKTAQIIDYFGARNIQKAHNAELNAQITSTMLSQQKCLSKTKDALDALQKACTSPALNADGTQKQEAIDKIASTLQMALSLEKIAQSGVNYSKEMHALYNVIHALQKPSPLIEASNVAGHLSAPQQVVLFKTLTQERMDYYQFHATDMAGALEIIEELEKVTQRATNLCSGHPMQVSEINDITETLSQALQQLTEKYAPKEPESAVTMNIAGPVTEQMSPPKREGLALPSVPESESEGAGDNASSALALEPSEGGSSQTNTAMGKAVPESQSEGARDNASSALALKPSEGGSSQINTAMGKAVPESQSEGARDNASSALALKPSEGGSSQINTAMGKGIERLQEAIRTFAQQELSYRNNHSTTDNEVSKTLTGIMAYTASACNKLANILKENVDCKQKIAPTQLERVAECLEALRKLRYVVTENPKGGKITGLFNRAQIIEMFTQVVFSTYNAILDASYSTTKQQTKIAALQVLSKHQLEFDNRITGMQENWSDKECLELFSVRVAAMHKALNLPLPKSINTDHPSRSAEEERLLALNESIKVPQSLPSNQKGRKTTSKTPRKKEAVALRTNDAVVSTTKTATRSPAAASEHTVRAEKATPMQSGTAILTKNAHITQNSQLPIGDLRSEALTSPPMETLINDAQVPESLAQNQKGQKTPSPVEAVALPPNEAQVSSTETPTQSNAAASEHTVQAEQERPMQSGIAILTNEAYILQSSQTILDINSKMSNLPRMEPLVNKLKELLDKNPFPLLIEQGLRNQLKMPLTLLQRLEERCNLTAYQLLVTLGKGVYKANMENAKAVYVGEPNDQKELLNRARMLHAVALIEENALSITRALETVKQLCAKPYGTGSLDRTDVNADIILKKLKDEPETHALQAILKQLEQDNPNDNLRQKGLGLSPLQWNAGDRIFGVSTDPDTDVGLLTKSCNAFANFLSKLHTLVEDHSLHNAFANFLSTLHTPVEDHSLHLSLNTAQSATQSGGESTEPASESDLRQPEPLSRSGPTENTESEEATGQSNLSLNTAQSSTQSGGESTEPASESDLGQPEPLSRSGPTENTESEEATGQSNLSLNTAQSATQSGGESTEPASESDALLFRSFYNSWCTKHTTAEEEAPGANGSGKPPERILTELELAGNFAELYNTYNDACQQNPTLVEAPSLSLSANTAQSRGGASESGSGQSATPYHSGRTQNTTREEALRQSTIKPSSWEQTQFRLKHTAASHDQQEKQSGKKLLFLSISDRLFGLPAETIAYLKARKISKIAIELEEELAETFTTSHQLNLAIEKLLENIYNVSHLIIFTQELLASGECMAPAETIISAYSGVPVLSKDSTTEKEAVVQGGATPMQSSQENISIQSDDGSNTSHINPQTLAEAQERILEIEKKAAEIQKILSATQVSVDAITVPNFNEVHAFFEEIESSEFFKNVSALQSIEDALEQIGQIRLGKSTERMSGTNAEANLTAHRKIGLELRDAMHSKILHLNYEKDVSQKFIAGLFTQAREMVIKLADETHEEPRLEGDDEDKWVTFVPKSTSVLPEPRSKQLSTQLLVIAMMIKSLAHCVENWEVTIQERLHIDKSALSGSGTGGIGRAETARMLQDHKKQLNAMLPRFARLKNALLDAIIHCNGDNNQRLHIISNLQHSTEMQMRICKALIKSTENPLNPGISIIKVLSKLQSTILQQIECCENALLLLKHNPENQLRTSPNLQGSAQSADAQLLDEPAQKALATCREIHQEIMMLITASELTPQSRENLDRVIKQIDSAISSPQQMLAKNRFFFSQLASRLVIILQATSIARSLEYAIADLGMELQAKPVYGTHPLQRSSSVRSIWSKLLNPGPPEDKIPGHIGSPEVLKAMILESGKINIRSKDTAKGGKGNLEQKGTAEETVCNIERIVAGYNEVAKSSAEKRPSTNLSQSFDQERTHLAKLHHVRAKAITLLDDLYKTASAPIVDGETALDGTAILSDEAWKAHCAQLEDLVTENQIMLSTTERMFHHLQIGYAIHQATKGPLIGEYNRRNLIAKMTEGVSTLKKAATLCAQVDLSGPLPSQAKLSKALKNRAETWARNAETLTKQMATWASSPSGKDSMPEISRECISILESMQEARNAQQKVDRLKAYSRMLTLMHETNESVKELEKAMPASTRGAGASSTFVSESSAVKSSIAELTQRAKDTLDNATKGNQLCTPDAESLVKFTKDLCECLKKCRELFQAYETYLPKKDLHEIMASIGNGEATANSMPLSDNGSHTSSTPDISFKEEAQYSHDTTSDTALPMDNNGERTGRDSAPGESLSTVNISGIQGQTQSDVPSAKR